MLVTTGTASLAHAPAQGRTCFRSRQAPAVARCSLQGSPTQFSNRCKEAFRSSRPAVANRRGATCAAASENGEWNPPTVAVTKRKFLEAYSKPISGIYDAVLQELLVQQHLIRYQKRYQYDPVSALGFVSVFDQVLEGLPQNAQDEIFKSYMSALDEDGPRFRKDATEWEEWAKNLSGAGELKSDDSGSEQQKALAHLGNAFANKKAVYSKFMAIGLFRLLELAGAKDPKALESLVNSLNLRPQAVNRDLVTYKGVLSKLSAAKDLMKEILAREKKKTAEREAAKTDLEDKGGDKKPADALEGKVDRATA